MTEAADCDSLSLPLSFSLFLSLSANTLSPLRVIVLEISEVPLLAQKLPPCAIKFGFLFLFFLSIPKLFWVGFLKLPLIPCH